MSGRYAVYYAPSLGSELDAFGNSWLGRDPVCGRELSAPPLRAIDTQVWESVTGTPRKYGFHGTLKAPFELREGATAEELFEYAEAFAARQRCFSIKGLKLCDIGSFLALGPGDEHAMDDLAEACLREFEPFRAEPSLADMERRRARGLSPRQERLLVRWGYPYVLEEFRFHLSLTGTIMDRGVLKKVKRQLMDMTAGLRAASHPVVDVCIFHQPDRQSPFLLVRRFPFLGGKA